LSNTAYTSSIYHKYNLGNKSLLELENNLSSNNLKKIC